MAAVLGHPRVSVIMPCYNTAQYVAEALGSVFAQTYTNYEVIVVNDGSPDTAALERAIAPWIDRCVYFKTANCGLGGARNNGIRASRGEFIALLDSDDIWEPGYLEAQVRYLDDEPGADIVYPNALNFGEATNLDKYCWYSRGAVTVSSLVRGQCDINTGRSLDAGVHDKCVVFYSVLARRAALERVGLFDARLRSCEDLDMWLRCANGGSRIIYHSRPLVRYRRRSDSLSADPVWMFDHITRVFQKARTILSLSDEERRLIDTALARFHGLKALHEGKRAFNQGDIARARDRLQEANEYLDSGRLRLALALLRIAPRLTRFAYGWKQRLSGG